MTPWRRWHRWLGTVAGLLLVLIGATGIFLQVDELTGMSDPPKPVPVDESQLVRDLAFVAERDADRPAVDRARYTLEGEVVRHDLQRRAGFDGTTRRA